MIRQPGGLRDSHVRLHQRDEVTGGKAFRRVRNRTSGAGYCGEMLWLFPQILRVIVFMALQQLQDETSCSFGDFVFEHLCLQWTE